MNSEKILITTTSSIEGYTIEKYLKTVNAHIVVGNNVFSDIAASFTDFFGGYSSSYQNKLTVIYNKALAEIKKETKLVGGNSVIGLKLDFDQISGKGTSMFMLTAIGTAVIIKPDQKKSNISNSIDEAFLLGAEVDIAIKKKKIEKELINNPTSPISESTWDFIIENRYSEISQVLLKSASLWIQKSLATDAENIIDKIKSYLQNLPENLEKELLYDLYLNENNLTFKKIILNIIKSKNILNNEKLILLIKSANVNDELKYKIFDLIVVRGEKLSAKEIPVYNSLLSLVKDNFKYVVEFQKQKKLLSSTEVDIWVCKCKNKNIIDLTHCSKCSLDKYGFPMEQINPDIAIEWLQNTIEILEEYKFNEQELS